MLSPVLLERLRAWCLPMPKAKCSKVAGYFLA